MSPEFFLSAITEKVRGFEITPIFSLGSVFAFMLAIVVYNWSGAAEKVENLTLVKKTIVFLIISIFVVFLYYIFYKAGKFEKLLSIPFFNKVFLKISNSLNL